MAVDHRHPQPDLKELQTRARSTDFYELLRRLEQPGKRFGRTGGIEAEPARLGQPIRMSFATGDIESLEIPANGSVPHVAVNAIGLFGPEGPMPLHLTKWMLERASNRWFAGDQSGATADRAFLDFANALQHRMIGFYWRAWADLRPEIQHAHGDGGAVGAMVRALGGTGLGGPEVASDTATHARLRHATSLFQRVESPRRLVEYLSSEIGHPVELIEFIGVWNDIPEALQTRLGQASSRLGSDATVGARFFDRVNRAEVRLGPMSYDDYLGFFDDPAIRHRLKQALQFVSGGSMQFDVRLMLEGQEVPAPKMAEVRLGQSTWIGADGKTPRGDMVIRDFTSKALEAAA
jgi:type VI secretion system protein ImpH